MVAESIPAFPVYLFDVDGTLVDSACDICGAIQEVLGANQRGDISDALLRRYIGRHLLDLFQDLFPGHNAQQIEEMIVHYRKAYPARNHAMTQCYAGVPEMLASLRGRKSTATTKGTPMTRLMLEKFALLPYFDHVQGTDGFAAKPAPDVIFASLDVFGAEPRDCLLVGDAPADMEAGRRAGVKTCAVLYGYGAREELLRWEPDYAIEHPGELEVGGDARRALDILKDVPKIEHELVHAEARQFGVNKIQRIEWNETGEKVYMRAWRDCVERHAPVLRGITPAELASVAKDASAFGYRLLRTPGFLPSREQRSSYASLVLAAALCVALHRSGWKLTYFAAGDARSFQMEEESIKPFDVIAKLAAGTLLESEWRARCEVLGIGMLDLGCVA